MKLPLLSVLTLMIAIGAAAQSRPAGAAETVAPNLPALRIGANDLLSVSVYQAPEFSRTFRVGADGSIRLPMLNRRIPVAGLHPAEVELAIATALREEDLLVEPVVTVTVAEYHSRPISVVGAVRRPVTFQAVGSLTLLDALARAEGLSPEAGPEILVSRQQKREEGGAVAITRRIPIRNLIDAADPDFNIALHGGEEIRVPETGRIYVVGNVKKPGAFALHSATTSTVLQMLALAEGLQPYTAKQAYIYRREASGSKHEIPLELSRIMQRKSPDVPLLADDILYVPDNKGRRLAAGTLERLATFGAGTVSGILVWRR